MRLSVASTGGATGSGSLGSAARFSAVYSFTGSTTQPSGGGGPLCAEADTAQQMMNNAVESDARKGSRYMGNSPLANSLRAHFETKRRGHRKETSPHFCSSRDRGSVSLVKLCLRCREVALSGLSLYLDDCRGAPPGPPLRRRENPAEIQGAATEGRPLQSSKYDDTTCEDLLYRQHRRGVD